MSRVNGLPRNAALGLLRLVAVRAIELGWLDSVQRSTVSGGESGTAQRGGDELAKERVRAGGVAGIGHRYVRVLARGDGYTSTHVPALARGGKHDAVGRGEERWCVLPRPRLGAGLPALDAVSDKKPEVGANSGLLRAIGVPSAWDMRWAQGAAGATRAGALAA